LSTFTYQPLTEVNEPELVAACRQNDRKAQKELYYRYCNAMYTTVYRIVNDPDEANDALQEAFLQVFRDIGKFRGESTLGAWIKTIVVRTAIRRIKKEDWQVGLDDAADLSCEASQLINGEYLEKIILSMPAGYRTVFLLTEVEGYTHEEVAGMLGISAGTSKSQLFHARRLLQRTLDKYARLRDRYE
jgi:RNA polymerase sigma-70 factor (ECF subfamily)